MRTLAYAGPALVHVHTDPAGDGRAPQFDALVQVTATRIWASDHSIHEGRRDFSLGALAIHESLADVLEVADESSQTRVGDIMYLRLAVGCGHCADCERGAPEFCEAGAPLAMAGPPSRIGAADVTALAWTVRHQDLDDAWQRIRRALHRHPAGLHSAPLTPAMLSRVGVEQPMGEESAQDYRQFGRRDDGWVSLVRPAR